MIGCKLVDSLIEAYHQLEISKGENVDVKRDQKLVSKLIYLSHTRLKISYVVGLIREFM